VTALIPHGKTRRQIGALIMWAKRRARDMWVSGFSPAGHAAMRTKAQRRVRTRGNQHTFQQKCKHGHSLADAYTYTRNGVMQRVCRMCVRLKDLARARRRAEDRILPELRARMLAAHPDRGGTSREFHSAHKAYLRAKAAA
jgi:DNA topoisomerase IB